MQIWKLFSLVVPGPSWTREVAFLVGNMASLIIWDMVCLAISRLNPVVRMQQPEPSTGGHGKGSCNKHETLVEAARYGNW